MKAKAPWYQFKAQADDPTTVDILVMDFIGDWLDEVINEYYGLKSPITAKQFLHDLAALPAEVKNIRVRINSPGGDVFAAHTIANALRDQRTSKGRNVETVIEGLAASSASIVMMAGDPVRIADNGMVMIHDPWTVHVGNAREMRKAADALDKTRDTIVSAYQWHSKLSSDELVALMEAETWMDADEAIANGLATEKVAGLKAAASIAPGPAGALKAPERFAARLAELIRVEDAPVPAPELASTDDVADLCEAAGLDLAFARPLLGKVSLADAQQLVAAEKDRRTAEAARESDIRALCTHFKVADLAEELLAGRMPVEQARALVAKVTAMKDRVEIDAGLKPDSGVGGKKPAINTAEIYAQLNKLH